MIDMPSHSRMTARAVSLLAALALLGACRQPEPQGGTNDAIEEPVPNLPAVPRPQPAIDRAAILAAVAQAASATAAGADDMAAQAALDGRQFEFRIRFGCKGPSTELRDEWLGWSHDGQSGTLRVRAMPTLSADDEFVTALGGEQFETVEGFWIPRPWLLEAACPATSAVSSAPAVPTADTASDETAKRVTEPVPSWSRIGIAQFFTETDPRTGRRAMRPYEAVKMLEPAQPVGSQGFNLVLSGRLKALPRRRVIACAAKDADSSPDCVVSAEFDRVWIERPGDREIIAEWGGG